MTVTRRKEEVETNILDPKFRTIDTELRKKNVIY